MIARQLSVRIRWIVHTRTKMRGVLTGKKRVVGLQALYHEARGHVARQLSVLRPMDHPYNK